MVRKGFRVLFKVWLEYRGKPLIGSGGVKLLKLVDDTGSISRAAEKMGVSYKFAWSYIKNIERRLGIKIVESYRGGRGGGYTRLTESGRRLVLFYEELFEKFQNMAQEFEDRDLLRTVPASGGRRCRVRK